MVGGPGGEKAGEAPMVDLYRVRTNLVGGTGAAQVSTMFFSSAAGETAQDAATAVRTFWFTIKDRISNHYVMTVEPEVFLIDQSTGEPSGIAATTTTSVTGIQESTPLPWMTQGLIRWQTGVFVGGRQIRGRTFIPGTTTTDNLLGVPTSTYTSELNTAAAALLGTTGVTLLTYSRKNHTSFAVVSRNTWDKWAELRSRRD